MNGKEPHVIPKTVTYHNPPEIASSNPSKRIHPFPPPSIKTPIRGPLSVLQGPSLPKSASTVMLDPGMLPNLPSAARSVSTFHQSADTERVKSAHIVHTHPVEGPLPIHLPHGGLLKDSPSTFEGFGRASTGRLRQPQMGDQERNEGTLNVMLVGRKVTSGANTADANGRENEGADGSVTPDTGFGKIPEESDVESETAEVPEKAAELTHLEPVLVDDIQHVVRTETASTVNSVHDVDAVLQKYTARVSRRARRLRGESVETPLETPPTESAVPGLYDSTVHSVDGTDNVNMDTPGGGGDTSDILGKAGRFIDRHHIFGQFELTR